MITNFLLLILISSTWIIMSSNNPMKTSFLILIAASVMFLMVKFNSGETWMPLIFYILFTGGILMMFMILSSVLPNEKTLKVKYSKILTVTVLVCAMISVKFSQGDMMSPHLKSFLSSGLNMAFMTSVILIYFFNSINLNSSEETPMRSLQC